MSLHYTACFNDVDVPSIDVEDTFSKFNEDQFFMPIVEALHGLCPEEQVKHLQLENLLPMSVRGRKKLFYQAILSVPKKSVSTLLQLCHYFKIARNFAFNKPLSD